MRWRIYDVEAEELGKKKKKKKQKLNGRFLSFLVTPLLPHFKDH